MEISGLITGISSSASETSRYLLKNQFSGPLPSPCCDRQINFIEKILLKRSKIATVLFSHAVRVVNIYRRSRSLQTNIHNHWCDDINSIYFCIAISTTDDRPSARYASLSTTDAAFGSQKSSGEGKAVSTIRYQRS